MADKNISWHEYEKAFGFLAVILNNSPNVDMVRQLRNVFGCSVDMNSDGDTHIGNTTMSTYWHRHAGTPLEDIVQELAADWTRLFRGVNPSYGPPPPYEGVYCGKDGIGVRIILEVKQEYLKHGLSIPDERNDRADYLGYELDFIRHLAERAAKAQESGQTEEEEIRGTVVCEFIQRHLSWVGDFCSKAADHVNTDFFGGFLMLLKDTVSEAAAGCWAKPARGGKSQISV